ncbi:MAG: nucleotidyltransferase family protein [bacterium]|nr:nucleotidyltransferase family protein [bacterium]MDD5756242.1 nucleotidyltransferase family protein [bacterium]
MKEMTMTKLERIEKILKRQKPILKKKYKIKELGIFGSYIRGDYKKGSDLDLLVDFSEIPGLFKFVEIGDYLSEIAGVKVDLVMRDALKPSLKRYIIKEVKYI